MYVDCPVNVVIAKRSDITIDHEIFPQTAKTFKSEFYQLITIKDPAEILREYTMESYINHYGFGDSVASVFVGSSAGRSGRAVLNPGETTYAKITFYNNAGFN